MLLPNGALAPEGFRDASVSPPSPVWGTAPRPVGWMACPEDPGVDKLGTGLHLDSCAAAVRCTIAIGSFLPSSRDEIEDVHHWAEADAHVRGLCALRVSSTTLRKLRMDWLAEAFPFLEASERVLEEFVRLQQAEDLLGLCDLPVVRVASSAHKPPRIDPLPAPRSAQAGYNVDASFDSFEEVRRGPTL
eukprot:scaffold731_cov261-Pinguiococcus_pyrenoidosus.AAC.80